MVIAIQILILLLTLTQKRGILEIISNKPLYKKYLLTEFIVQTACIIINIVMIFVARDLMGNIMSVQMMATLIIFVAFIRKAKRCHNEKLKKVLLEEDLLRMDLPEIRRYLIEKHGIIYSSKELEEFISRNIENM